MRCTKCDKRLTRKTARQIDGNLMCSACIFPPLKNGMPDLAKCPTCGKIAGRHKGWRGPECFCNQPVGDALKGAPSVGTRR